MISEHTDKTTDPENVKVNPPTNTSNVTPDKQLQSPKKSPQPKRGLRKNGVKVSVINHMN